MISPRCAFSLFAFQTAPIRLLLSNDDSLRYRKYGFLPQRNGADYRPPIANVVAYVFHGFFITAHFSQEPFVEITDS
jgi:hypothetical protein